MAEKNEHFKKVLLIPQNEWNKKYGQIEVSPKCILIKKTIFIVLFFWYNKANSRIITANLFEFSSNIENDFWQKYVNAFGLNKTNIIT